MDTETFTRRIYLDDPQIKKYKESKKNGVTQFNFKTIDHFREGKRIFVYPAGTYGGGQIGLISKSDERYINSSTYTQSYELDGKDIYLEIVTARRILKKKENKSTTKWLIWVVVILILGAVIRSCKSEARTIQYKYEKISILNPFPTGDCMGTIRTFQGS